MLLIYIWYINLINVFRNLSNKVEILFYSINKNMINIEVRIEIRKDIGL